mgnify:CR=1 FL=1
MNRVLRSCSTGALLLCASLVLPAARQDAPPSPEKVEPPTRHPVSGLERIQVPLADEVFLMEIADAPTSRARGLGGRLTIPRDEGMLFAYPKKDVLGFWMKGCLTDIDIAYVSSDGRIMSMYRMKKPPVRLPDERIATYEGRLTRYPSRHLVQFALEFAPGTLDRLGIKLGDRVELPRRRLIDKAR